MFGCLLEIECDVSTYCFHGDVFQQNIICKTGFRTLPGLSLFALIAAPFLNSWQNTLSHSSSQSPFGILNYIYCPDLPPVIYLFEAGIFDHWWGCQGGEERADEVAQTIFWSGWWKHLTLWDSEKNFPNTSVIELCVSALQRKGTTLALWSYQKEKERKAHIYFRQIFLNTESDFSIVCGLLVT